MNFFERQDQARRKTRVLVCYFLLAVIAIIAAVYLLITLAFFWPRDGFEDWSWLWSPKNLLYVMSGTLGVVAVGAGAKLIALRGGGASVAEMLGGRRLDPGASDPEERVLLNVVEEMAIASGTPVPDVYILDHETGINAFAAGYTIDDAVIGVTRGATKLLNRDELQAVIAHEFSHVVHGDMRLNVRLIGLLSGILALTIVGRVLLQASFGSGRRRSRDSGQGAIIFALVALGLIVIGGIGVFFGRLIKSAVSRQREYLADAAAVQFTRNPDGLAGALKKIGGYVKGSMFTNPHAEEASHLFFGNGLGESWFRLLSTHPPLVERIRAIDPAFDGKFPRVVGGEKVRPPVSEKSIAQKKAAGMRQSWGPAMMAGAVMESEELVAQIGKPTLEHLDYAAQMRADLPEGLVDAAHNPLGAVAVVYGLALSNDPAVRREQRDIIMSQAGLNVPPEFDRLLPLIEPLDSRAKLPLASVAISGLRGLSPRQYQDFLSTLEKLAAADRQIDLFEYALQMLVRRHLRPHFEGPRKNVVQFYAYPPVIPHIELLLSALAHLGHADQEGKEAAFRNGMLALGRGESMRLRPLEESGLQAVDEAIEQLRKAAPAIRERALRAGGYAIASDGKITTSQAELIRAIADGLELPLPPFLQKNPDEVGSSAV